MQQNSGDFIFATLVLCLTLTIHLTFATQTNSTSSPTIKDDVKLVAAASSRQYLQYAPATSAANFYDEQPELLFGLEQPSPRYSKQFFADTKYSDAPKYEPLQEQKYQPKYNKPKFNIEIKYDAPVSNTYDEPHSSPYFAPSHKKFEVPSRKYGSVRNNIYDAKPQYAEKQQYAEKHQQYSQPSYLAEQQPYSEPLQKHQEKKYKSKLSYVAEPYQHSVKSKENYGTPSCAQQVHTTYCLDDYYYPTHEIEQAIESSRESFAKMYAEALPEAYHHEDEEYSSGDKGQTENDDVYDKDPYEAPTSLNLAQMCPSHVEPKAKVKRARNAQGKWQIVVQTHGYEQSVRLETCKTSRECCNFVSKHYDSECVQKHAFQRLVIFDQWNKYSPFRVDIFKLPSCCSCQVNSHTNKHNQKCNKRGYDDDVYGGPAQSLPLVPPPEPLKKVEKHITYEIASPDQFPPGPPPAPEFASAEPLQKQDHQANLQQDGDLLQSQVPQIVTVEAAGNTKDEGGY